MLPNHSPLVVAEQFGTLEALHPGRIDLGIGRAPGTDPLTAQALRRAPLTMADDFPEQFGQLIGYFDGSFADDHPYRNIRAVPGLGYRPAIWLLGSSDYSARLAGLLGLPFSFAHHFASANTEPALADLPPQLPAVGGARRALRAASACPSCARPPTKRRAGCRRRTRSRSSGCAAAGPRRTRRRRKRPSTRTRRPSGRSCGGGPHRTSSARPTRAGPAARARGAHRCERAHADDGRARARRTPALLRARRRRDAAHAGTRSRPDSRQGATCIMSVKPDGSCLPMLPCSKMPQPT